MMDGSDLWLTVCAQSGRRLTITLRRSSRKSLWQLRRSECCDHPSRPTRSSTGDRGLAKGRSTDIEVGNSKVIMSLLALESTSWTWVHFRLYTQMCKANLFYTVTLSTSSLWFPRTLLQRQLRPFPPRIRDCSGTKTFSQRCPDAAKQTNSPLRAH